jgi:hypothetical protein
MKLYDLIKNYDFHDSSVDDLQYDKINKKLVINIELCNWRQKGYKKDEPEIVLCKLVFSEVKKYTIKPECEKFGDDEILNVVVRPVEDILHMVLLTSKQEVKNIEILANDVEIKFM